MLDCPVAMVTTLAPGPSSRRGQWVRATPTIMASSIDQSTPDPPGKAVVFLKAPKGNDDPYAVVRHTTRILTACMYF